MAAYASLFRSEESPNPLRSSLPTLAHDMNQSVYTNMNPCYGKKLRLPTYWLLTVEG
jgi:hypothetical protein